MPENFRMKPAVAMKMNARLAGAMEEFPKKYGVVDLVRQWIDVGF